MPFRTSILAAAFALAAFPAFALNSVTILADPTMGSAVAEIARNYSREHNIIASTVFTSAPEQQTEISEGGSADVLITPRTVWIEQLKTQGLIDINSKTLVAKNHMALVGPADSPLEIGKDKPFPTTQLLQQMGSEQLFVVGNPETMQEGIFGKESLRALDVAGDLEENTLYIKHLDQMLEMVRNQHAYGIFFSSSAQNRGGVKIIQLLPASSHRPIEYFAVAIAGENMVEARKFIEYLKSSAVRKVLRENGMALD